MKKYTTSPLLLTTDSNEALNQFSGLTATYCSVFNTTLILLGQEIKNALGKPSFKKVFYHMCCNVVILKI